jgi:proteasome assembly chaperone (PAC2) family protein
MLKKFALREEGHSVYAKVMREQFVVNDDSIIHTPTAAEFRPAYGTGDSVVVWTGDIGKRLPDGHIYRYADVLDTMKRLRREISSLFVARPA